MDKLTIVFKNCPSEVLTMIQACFNRAPNHVVGQKLEFPETMEIDFNDVEKGKMTEDTLNAIFTFLMAYTWIKVKKIQHESR